MEETLDYLQTLDAMVCPYGMFRKALSAMLVLH